MKPLLRLVPRAPLTGTAPVGAAPLAARPQVLPLRHAPRQLELPLSFASAPAPRPDSLRTG